MTMPSVPEKTQPKALTDLLESIALEEVALAHLINGEAEKVQKVAKWMEQNKIGIDDVIKFEKSVSKMMRAPIKKEILLQFKLEDVLDFKSELETDC